MGLRGYRRAVRASAHANLNNNFLACQCKTVVLMTARRHAPPPSEDTAARARAAHVLCVPRGPGVRM
eukprot:129557-Pyramimonas_sp.AAC.1